MLWTASSYPSIHEHLLHFRCTRSICIVYYCSVCHHATHVIRCSVSGAVLRSLARPYCIISCYLWLQCAYAMSWHEMSWCAMFHYGMISNVMSFHAMPCRAMPCHVTSRYVMSRHVTSRRVPSRPVTSRPVASRYVTSSRVASRHVHYTYSCTDTYTCV